jgi:hypothetical protein
MRPIALFLAVSLTAGQMPGQSPPPRIDVSIVDGNGAMASSANRAGRPITVLVQDQNKRPVAGASVTAILPASGVGGEFRDVESTIKTLETDGAGRATFASIKLRPLSGSFPIRFVAKHQNLSSSATATQTVAEPAAPAQRRFSRPWMAMAIVAAAGTAAGIYVALDDDDDAPKTAGFRVSPGSPVLGGPR